MRGGGRVQALECLDASLDLAGLGGLRAEPVDEPLQMHRLLLLFLVYR